MNLGDLLEQLDDVAQSKVKRDLKGTWSKGGITYFEALYDELEEVKAELESGRQCFLEDELGDILWDYLCLLRHLEVEGKIDSKKVFSRSLQKYNERVTGIHNGEQWADIKKKQKIKLLSEQQLLDAKN